MNFFIKDGCNLVIDRKLNAQWKKIEKEKVLDFLDSTNLIWHKNLDEDEAVFVFENEELIDGKCKILSAELKDNLNKDSVVIDLYRIDK